jgi:hypothetical protein
MSTNSLANRGVLEHISSFEFKKKEKKSYFGRKQNLLKPLK